MSLFDWFSSKPKSSPEALSLSTDVHKNAFNLEDIVAPVTIPEVENDITLLKMPDAIPVKEELPTEELMGINKKVDLTPITKTTNAAEKLENPTSEFLEEAKAQRQLGRIFKTVGSAGQLFNAIINASSNTRKLEEDVTAQSIDLKMKEIDNQILYTKGQILDKFNQLVAHNTVQLAAKNLKVTSGSVLEQSKGTAQDLSEDIETLEGNARIQKIALQSQKEQASIYAGLRQKLEGAAVVGGIANLGFSVSSLFGGNEALVDLFKPKVTGDLNKTVYGG